MPTAWMTDCNQRTDPIGPCLRSKWPKSAGFEFKFYQKLEGGRKPQIKVETVERLAKPFGLEAWQLLAPALALKGAKVKFPKARTPSQRGPRAKWKGETGT